VTSRARHVARASCTNPKRDRTLANPGRDHDRQDLARCHRRAARTGHPVTRRLADPVAAAWWSASVPTAAGRARWTPPSVRATARGGRGGSHGRLRADDARISASRPFA